MLYFGHVVFPPHLSLIYSNDNLLLIYLYRSGCSQGHLPGHDPQPLIRLHSARVLWARLPARRLHHAHGAATASPRHGEPGPPPHVRLLQPPDHD